MASIDVLRRFKMFSDVSDASLARLGAGMESQRFAAGDVLSQEGEDGATLYLIVRGQVNVEKKIFGEVGSSKVVAKLGAGEFFGEMSFLQGTSHSATVVAVTDGDVVALSRRSLDELLKHDSVGAFEELMALAAGLSGRLRSTTRELVTVYEVANAIASSTSMEELGRQVVGQLKLDLGADVSVGFYRWNVYNAELNLLESRGDQTTSFPANIDDPMALTRILDNRDGSSFKVQEGQLVLTPIFAGRDRLGLFAYLSKTTDSFDAGERQMMETVAAILSPAILSLQHREEDAARKRLAQYKQFP